MAFRLTGGHPALTTALMLSVLSACVGPTTQLPPLPPGAVKAEEEKQRELALDEYELQQTRLDNIAYPILVMGTSLCLGDQGRRMGVRLATLRDYDREFRPAAARTLALSDTLTVLSVTYGGPADRGGLRPGDRLVAIGNEVVQPGEGSVKKFTNLLLKYQEAGNQEFPILVQRGGERRRALIRLDEVCDYPTIVVENGELQAYADGKAIYLTSTMMRFVDDDELRVVVAHEFAHNAMGHIKARKKNSLFGALLGALGDIAMAARGFNTGGYYTSQGAKLGAMTFSQDFEREADYVGLYALTLADLDIHSAPRFWRHMAQANPKNIGFASSHPTTAERFVRMEQTIAEVQGKVALRQPLQPDRAGTRKLIQPVDRSFAGTAPGRDTGIANHPSPNAAIAQPRVAQPGGSEAGLTATATAEPTPQGYAPAPAAVSPPAADGTPSSSRLGKSTERFNVAGEGRSPDDLARNPQMRDALNDLLRLAIVIDYRERRPGVLTLTVGHGFTKENAAGFQLGLLYVAYSGARGMGETATLELWRGDVKIGEYTNDGLTLITESSQSR